MQSTSGGNGGSEGKDSPRNQYHSKGKKGGRGSGSVSGGGERRRGVRTVGEGGERKDAYGVCWKVDFGHR